MASAAVTDVNGGVCVFGEAGRFLVPCCQRIPARRVPLQKKKPAGDARWRALLCDDRRGILATVPYGRMV